MQTTQGNSIQHTDINPPLSPFHSGEQQIQHQRGVREEAEQRGLKMLTPTLQPAQQSFAQQRHFVMTAHCDEQGLPWAGLMVGPTGFISFNAADAFNINWQQAKTIAPLPLQAGQALGLLAIDFDTRRRLRINSRLFNHGATQWQLTIDQGYGNCPKYIQDQSMQTQAFFKPIRVNQSTTLNERQSQWIRNSHTFFIATSSGMTSPDTSHQQQALGADISHRGGDPGFIELSTNAAGQQQLWFEDYSGNNMFNTLGNIQRHPFAGLLFINFDCGAMLQISGKASLLHKHNEGVAIDVLSVRHWQAEN